MQGKFKRLVQNILNIAPSITPMSSIYPIKKKLEHEVLGVTKKNSALIEQENTWTALIALGYIGNEKRLFSILTEGASPPKSALMICEAQPKSRRTKSVFSDYYEGNSHIDVAIGDIARRGKRNGDKSINGIEYNGAIEGAVCFVEAKLGSDISCYSGLCFYRNQIVRVAENLALFSGIGLNEDNNYPNHIHLTLMTPRCFRERQRIRLYSYLYEHYSSEGGAESLFKDIREPYPCWKDTRKYNDELNDEEQLLLKRLKLLKLHWVTHEEAIEGMPCHDYRDALKELIDEVEKVGSMLDIK